MGPAVISHNSQETGIQEAQKENGGRTHYRKDQGTRAGSSQVWFGEVPSGAKLPEGPRAIIFMW